MTLSVFAPVSIANLSVGFDSLGLALTPLDGSLLGDIIHLEYKSYGESSELQVKGRYADKLPEKLTDNIVWQCLVAFEKALAFRQIAAEPLTLTLEKNIPVGSGLGSSACSVVAALVGLNHFYHKPFSDHQLLEMMGQQEAVISGGLHYDNVAPCFFGGLQLMLPQPDKICQALPFFSDCYWVMAYPDRVVSTKSARQVLPQHYPRQTMLEFGQNLAGFVDACYRSDKFQAFALLKDVVAEPYRRNLLPGFDLAKQTLRSLGCLAVGISGSGPTLFTVCDELTLAEQARQWLEANYLASEQGFVTICRVDHDGARIITPADPAV